MLNRNKSRKGFTLVEVIVVAVIVAILAAVGVPILSGFIADARQNSVNVLAETAAAAASSMAKKLPVGKVVTLDALGLNYDSDNYTIVVDDPPGTVTVSRTGADDKEISFR